MKRWLLIISALSHLRAMTGCGYNDFQSLDETSNARLERGAEPIPAPR